MSKNPETTKATETPATNNHQPAEAKKSKNRTPKTGKALAVVKGSKSTTLSPAKAEKLLDLAKEIRELHESATEIAPSIRERQMEALEQAVRCGKALIAAKALVGHGKWMVWLKSNCKISHDTCTRYVKLASNYAHVRNLEEGKSMRQALKLLSDPEKNAAPKKEKAGSGAEDGEDQLHRVTSLAKRLLDTLGRLPREKQNEAFEVLNGIQEWLRAAAVDVKATRVG